MIEDFNNEKDVISTFSEWINGAEGAYSQVEGKNKKAREYYENAQKPSGIPASKAYLIENLCTDLIDGLVGKLIGNDVSINISGGGKMADPIRELVKDILRRNKFKERIKEPVANRFYVEGFGGFRVVYDPFKKSPYGVGMPQIFALRPGEILLDSDSKGWMHEDDVKRIYPTDMLLSEAKIRWKNKASQLEETSRGQGVEKWVKIYEIEFKRIEKIENLFVDVFYHAKIGNTNVLLDSIKPTGFHRFTGIPVIHTPCEETSIYPNGVMALIMPTQDSINVLSSISNDSVKSDIKNFRYTVGASPEEEAKVKNELTKTDGYVNFQNTTERDPVRGLESRGISKSVIELYRWKRQAFEDITRQYEPSRGQATGLSGKAVIALQQGGILPEFPKKDHFEYATGEVGECLIECIALKMGEQPFSITSKIDGNKTKIRFNTEGKEEDEYNINENGMINDLTKIDIDDIDISVEVNMNEIGRKEMEANKALICRNAGLLSRVDTTKEIYPVKWKEYYENKTNEDQAAMLMEKLAQNPEVMQEVAAGLEKIEVITDLAKKEQKGLSLEEEF